MNFIPKSKDYTLFSNTQKALRKKRIIHYATKKISRKFPETYNSILFTIIQ